MKPPNEAAVLDMPGADAFAEAERTEASRKEAARIKAYEDRKQAAAAEEAARTSVWKPPIRKLPEDEASLLNHFAKVDVQEASVIAAFKKAYQRREPNKDLIVFSGDFRDPKHMSESQLAAMVEKTSDHLLTAYKRLDNENRRRLLDMIDLRELRDAPHDDPSHQICDRRINDLKEKHQRYKDDKDADRADRARPGPAPPGDEESPAGGFSGRMPPSPTRRHHRDES